VKYTRASSNCAISGLTPRGERLVEAPGAPLGDPEIDEGLAVAGLGAALELRDPALLGQRGGGGEQGRESRK
jgi:hypothetical protein